MTLDDENSLQLTAYVVYDTKTQSYGAPFILPKSKHAENMRLLVNDVASQYYNHENDYILYEVGLYDDKIGRILYEDKLEIGHLDIFIDYHMRDIQTCIQTLNYLPTGYFRMDKEMQASIQERIDEAIHYYTEKFVKPSFEKDNLVLNP